MKGLTKKDIPVVIFLVSALILVLSYSFVWVNGSQKIADLKESNEILNAEVNNLREKAANKRFYEDETARMKDEIDAIFEFFPADVLMEDGIATAMELEEKGPMISNGISYTPAVELYNAGAGVPPEAVDTSEPSYEEDAETAGEGDATVYSDGEAAPAGDEAIAASGIMGEYGPIALRNSVFTYNFETSYSGFKNIVDYFTNLPSRTSISDVSLGFDSGSGLLNGSMTVNRYSMTGTGELYTPPVFPAVSSGKTNIFGTLEFAQEPAPEEEENEETEEESAQ